MRRIKETAKGAPVTELWVIGDKGHVAGPCESESAAEATRIWGEYVFEPERFEIRAMTPEVAEHLGDRE